MLSLDVLFWLTFIFWASLERGDLAGFAVLGGFYYGALSLIPAFIVGAIIGAVTSKIQSGSGSTALKGLKIGLTISVILSFLMIIAGLYQKYTNPYRLYGQLTEPAGLLNYYLVFSPAEITFTILFIAIFTLIGYAIGKLRKK